VGERARRHDALLLVDEVYHHFCDVTALPLLAELDNLVVARSFSKAFGIAGARVGALAAEPGVIQQLYKLKPRHEISALSARIAEYLLDRPEVMEDYVTAVCESRDRLGPALTRLGFAVIPSEGPCLMARVPEGIDRDDLVALLWDAGIEVGGGLEAPHQRYVRVGVGPWSQMEGFLASLAAVIVAMRAPVPMVRTRR
jgi:histidinol-phosphate aminotransferase